MLSRSRRIDWRGYFFVAPAGVYLAVFALLPIALAGWMALHRWHLLKPEHTFLGWGNFTHLGHDPFFRNAIWNTLVFVGWSVPLSVAAALLVAMLVAQPLRGVGFFRTLFYVPAVASQVALSMVWTWVLMPTTGLVNAVLGWLNQAGMRVSDVLGGLGLSVSLPALPTDTNFLEQAGWAMAALVAMFLWIGLGPRMIIFVAGLQSIPEALYEAAALDGCTGWQRLRHVTLPMLLPTTLFVVVTTTIAAFQIFTPVYVLTRGGPQRSTDVVLYHVYTEAWQKLEVGMASAMSYVLFGMILLVSLAQFVLMRRGTQSEAAA